MIAGRSASALLFSFLQKICNNYDSWLGTGGMATKITAMSKVTENGIMGVIADGAGIQVLEKIVDQDDVGTFFAAQ